MVILLHFHFERQRLCTYVIHIFARVVFNLVQPLFEEMKFFFTHEVHGHQDFSWNTMINQFCWLSR